MLEVVNGLLANKDLGIAQTVIGSVLCIFLIILFVIKSSRDERGRAIIGKASIVSTSYFIVIMCVVGQNLLSLEHGLVGIVNIMQFIFNTVIFLQIVIILILKRIS